MALALMMKVKGAEAKAIEEEEEKKKAEERVYEWDNEADIDRGMYTQIRGENDGPPMDVRHARAAAEILDMQGLCIAMEVDPDWVASEEETRRAEERLEDLEGLGIIHTHYDVTDYRGWFRNGSGVLKGNIPIIVTGKKNTSYNPEVRWEAYHQVRIQVHEGSKGDCKRCKNEQEDPQRRNITRTNMILQEANKQLRKRQGKEAKTERENKWWEKLKTQANIKLAKETKKGQAHSVNRQESKQRTRNYHRGKAEDCKTCKQRKNEQQQVQKEELDEMKLYDYEWAEWEKTGNTDELEWRVETEQYKQDREQRRIDREEEMVIESIEEGYIEDEEMEKAVGEWEWEREMEEREMEEEEDEVKDGECLGCGNEQRKGTQCLSCGAPVEPKNGSEHYMFGWHEGKREACEHDECREWIERDILTEWKKEGRHETREYKRGRTDRRIMREEEMEKEKEMEEEAWRVMYEESLEEGEKPEREEKEEQRDDKEERGDGQESKEKKDKGKQKRKDREVSIIQEEEEEPSSQVWQIRRVGEENRFQRDYERASTSGQGTERGRGENRVIEERPQDKINKEQQKEETTNEQNKGKGKRRHRHTPHKHIGQDKEKEKGSKTVEGHKGQIENRLTRDRTTNERKNRDKNTKRERKWEEDGKGRLITMILGIMAIAESVRISKKKNKGKQRTKKAREKRRQRKDIREKEYIEATSEAELERIWQEEERRHAEKIRNARRRRKKGIKKEKIMGKRWKKGKYGREVNQEKERAKVARGRWEEKLLRRMEEEQKKENKKREGEIDGRLAIIMLSMIAGTAQRQGGDGNQFREDKENI